MSEYCLRWNNHQPNFVKVFSDLLTTEALVDVTLATDGHFIQAHQLVLSACSVYFRDLFMTNPCRHPIVILKDIRIEDLKTVIDFIYRGEVNVCQERLPDVLKVAGSLRIKGLAENQQTVEEIPSHAGYRPRQQASSSSSVRNDLQSSSQRSSLTDSRELSLSVEGDDQEGAATPPPSKKRKASSQESSESCPDVPEEKPRLTDVKEEPRDDRENDRSHSQETESEYNVGGNGEADDSSSSGIGVSASAGGNSSGGEGASLIPQSQEGNKKKVLYQNCPKSKSSVPKLKCALKIKTNSNNSINLKNSKIRNLKTLSLPKLKISNKNRPKNSNYVNTQNNNIYENNSENFVTNNMNPASNNIMKAGSSGNLKVSTCTTNLKAASNKCAAKASKKNSKPINKPKLACTKKVGKVKVTNPNKGNSKQLDSSDIPLKKPNDESVTILPDIGNYASNDNVLITENKSNNVSLNDVNINNSEQNSSTSEISNINTAIRAEPVLTRLDENERELLNTEVKLLRLDRKLRQSLSVTDPNLADAVLYLDLIESLTLTNLMLKKNPHIVDAVRKCARYKNDDRVRIKAEVLFNKIKTLFPTPDPNLDWDAHFDKIVEEFVEACKITGIKKEMLIYLVQDPTELFSAQIKTLALRSNGSVSITKNEEKDATVFNKFNTSRAGGKQIVGRVQPSRVKKMTNLRIYHEN